MKTSIQRIYEILIVLTQKEIKIKYKNNMLGYLWAIANPLMFTLIYFCVQSVYEGSGPELSRFSCLRIISMAMD